MKTLLILLLASPALAFQDGPRSSAPRPPAWEPSAVQRGAASAHEPPELAPLPAHQVDRSEVHYDRPEGGALWARGATYKARFDADGVEFIPFFGSHAPRNFPIRFTLEEVTCDGRPLAIDAVGRVQRTGDAVRIERGDLTETYLVRADSIEQTFVFDPAPRGELNLRIRVETELEWGQGLAGIELAGELGKVGYGAAVLVDGGGVTSELQTTWEPGVIEIRVPASTLAASTGLVTVDPVIATFPVDTFPVKLRLPDVAYDAASDSFLVVYEEWYSGTDIDVYSTRLDAAGGFLDSAYVDMTTATWEKPHVANNGGASQFLVAATTHGRQLVEGRLRDASTATYGAAFEITQGESGEMEDLEIGGDFFPGGESYYCVAWSRELSSTDTDIHARLVATDGTLLGGGTMLIADGVEFDQGVSVSKTNGGGDFDTSAWSIVWRRPDPTGGGCDLWAAEVLWNGLLLRPAYRLLDASYCVRSVKVSSPLDGPGDRTYLVTHDRDYGSDHDVFATVVRGGNAVAQINLSAAEGSFAHTQRIANPDSDGLRFFVTYHQEYTGTLDIDIYAATLNLLDDALCITEGRVPVSTGGSESFPSLTSTRANGGPPASPSQGAREYMLVWEDATADPSHIDGARFFIEATCVGDAFCGSELNSASVRARLDADSTLVAGSPLLLSASQLPAGQFGYFLASRGTGFVSPPGSDGNLCLGLPIARFSALVLNSGPGGRFWATIDTSVIPMSPPVSVLPGEDWHFQAWFRDGASSNFTNAITVVFE